MVARVTFSSPFRYLKTRCFCTKSEGAIFAPVEGTDMHGSPGSLWHKHAEKNYNDDDVVNPLLAHYRKKVDEQKNEDFHVEWIERRKLDLRKQSSYSSLIRSTAERSNQVLGKTDESSYLKRANRVELAPEFCPRSDSLWTRLTLAGKKHEMDTEKQKEEERAKAREDYKNELYSRTQKGIYVFRYTKRFRLERSDAVRYKKKKEQQSFYSQANNLKKRLPTNNNSIDKILDIDQLSLKQIHEQFMYTMVRWLPAERCIKIIGRIAKFRDVQTQGSYERLLLDCGGGNHSGSWRRHDHSSLMAECGPELVAYLCRCYQTISLPFMLDYVRKFGKFSRSYITKLVEKSTNSRLFDFVRYPERDGARPLPGIVINPHRLESYVKLLPKCSANNYLYDQLKIRNLITPTEPSAYYASSPRETALILSAQASESLSQAWNNTNVVKPLLDRPGHLLDRSLLEEKDSTVQHDSNTPHNDFFKEGINRLSHSMQTTKIAPTFYEPLPKSPANTEVKNELLDPSYIHPRTYRSLEQRFYGQDPPANVWWSPRWKGSFHRFVFKRKLYQRTNQSPHWRVHCLASNFPNRRRPKHSRVRRKVAQKHKDQV